MIRIARRIYLLTALALLVSGLLQPLAAAQGLVCTRTTAPAQEAQHSALTQADGAASATEPVPVATDPHQHDSVPQSLPTSIPSAPCGVAAISSDQRLPSADITGRQILHTGDPLPASLFNQSLFRPPRLS